MLKKDAEFKIGPAEMQSIEQLKNLLITEPVLHIYIRGAPTELHTDASKDGYGAVLLQTFDEKQHPTYFWSKKTSQAESKQHSYVLDISCIFGA